MAWKLTEFAYKAIRAWCFLCWKLFTAPMFKNLSLWNNDRFTGSCKKLYWKILFTLHTQFSLMVTSCITIVQYQNQKIALGATHMAYSDFTSFTCTHFWVYGCTLLYNFIPCVDWCNHHHNQGTKLFHHHKDPSTPPLQL